jgi:hypothetical protein
MTRECPAHSTEKRDAPRPGAPGPDGEVFYPDCEPDLAEYLYHRHRHDYGECPELGVTTGWLLPDGRAVQMGRGRQRDEDHRASIPSAEAMARWGWPEGVIREHNECTRGPALRELMRRSGAARVLAWDASLVVESCGPLSRRQRAAVRDYAIRARVRYVMLDVGGRAVELDPACPDAVEDALEGHWRCG